MNHNLNASQVQSLLIIENIDLGSDDSIATQWEQIVPTGEIITRWGSTRHEFDVYGTLSYYTGGTNAAGELETYDF